jgi:hypothetical protein
MLLLRRGGAVEIRERRIVHGKQILVARPGHSVVVARRAVAAERERCDEREQERNSGKSKPHSVARIKRGALLAPRSAVQARAATRAAPLADECVEHRADEAEKEEGGGENKADDEGARRPREGTGRRVDALHLRRRAHTQRQRADGADARDDDGDGEQKRRDRRRAVAEEAEVDRGRKASRYAHHGFRQANSQPAVLRKVRCHRRYDGEIGYECRLALQARGDY